MKEKQTKYWYIVIAIVLIMFAFGYIFELGEALGNAMAN